MSMRTNFQTGEEPDLFHGGKTFAEVLENEDVLYVNSSDDEDDDSENEEVHPRKVESDTDRIAREEVEQILAFRRKKEQSKEAMQKELKQKKETRRERKNKEWAQEMQDVREDIDKKAGAEFARHEALSSDSEDEDDDDDVDMLTEATTAGPDAADAEAASGGASTSGNWRDECRADRWFAQGIFIADVATTDEEVEKRNEVRVVEEDDESDRDGDIQEMDEKDIVKLPLTDKQQRRKQGLKNKKHNERRKEIAMAKDGDEDETYEEDDRRPLLIVPAHVPAEGCLSALPRETVSMEARTDPREKAEVRYRPRDFSPVGRSAE